LKPKRFTKIIVKKVEKLTDLEGKKFYKKKLDEYGILVGTFSTLFLWRNKSPEGIY